MPSPTSRSSLAYLIRKTRDRSHNRWAVTIYAEGIIRSVDQALAGGPFIVGQTIRTAYVYDNNPAPNPDLNQLTQNHGQYELMTFAALNVDGVMYNLKPAPVELVFTVFGGLSLGIADGMDASAILTAPSVGPWSAYYFIVNLRDLNSTTFPSDELAQTIPRLEEFELASLLILYTQGTELIQAIEDLAVHQDITGIAGDFDNDGFGDNSDAFPHDPSKH